MFLFISEIRHAVRIHPGSFFRNPHVTMSDEKTSSCPATVRSSLGRPALLPMAEICDAVRGPMTLVSMRGPEGVTQMCLIIVAPVAKVHMMEVSMMVKVYMVNPFRRIIRTSELVFFAAEAFLLLGPPCLPCLIARTAVKVIWIWFRWIHQVVKRDRFRIWFPWTFTTDLKFFAAIALFLRGPTMLPSAVACHAIKWTFGSACYTTVLTAPHDLGFLEEWPLAFWTNVSPEVFCVLPSSSWKSQKISKRLRMLEM